MFSFQGDFKRQRNINLGGNRRNGADRSNTQAILSRAHDERQKREQERRKQKAAWLIQLFLRGRRDTADWRRQMRSTLDLSCLESRSQLDLDSVYTALLGFTAYYNASSQEDIDKLHCILYLLFGNADSSHDTDAAVSYNRIVESLDAKADPAFTFIYYEKWAALIARIFGCAMKNSHGQTRVRLNIDLLLTCVLRAATLNSKSLHSGNSHKPFSELVLRALIASQDLYPFLATHISSIGKTQSNSSVALAIDIAALPVVSPALQDLAVPYFARWILAIPGLPSKIGVRGVTSITRSHVKWDILAGHAHKMVERWQMKQQQTPDYTDDISRSGIFSKRPFGDIALPLVSISILGNLTAFVLPQLSQADTPSNIDKNFVEACAACARVIPVCDLFESKKTSATGGDIGARLVRAVDPSALKWLNSLFSVQVLKFLVQSSCDNACEHSSIAEELLLIFIQKWGKTVNRAVVDNIFQAVDIRTIGWRAVLKDQKFVDSFAGSHVSTWTIKQHGLAQFQLLCEVFNRQLQSIGDDELFAQGMSLPIDEIRVVARACRNIAFSLYWSQETSDELIHIRDVSAELTQQLFVRDMRHQFVDDGFWLMPPSLLDMASFADRVVEDPMFTSDNGDTEDESIGTSDSEVYSDDSDYDSDSEAASNVPGNVPGVSAPNDQFGWLVNTYSEIARRRQGHVDRTVVTPRIAVLKNIPFVVPFKDRVRLFHALINRDRTSIGLAPLGQNAHSIPYGRYPSAHAVIRRGHVFEDGFRALFPVLSGKPVSEDAQSIAAPTDDHNNSSGSRGGGAISSSETAAVGMERQWPPAPHEQSALHVRMPGGSGFNIAPWPFDLGAEDGFGEPESMFDSNDPFAWTQRNANQISSLQNMAGRGRLDRISRINIFKQRMQIEFEDRYGMPEAGIDGGGLFKEFLTSLIQEAFSPQMGLFNTTRQNSLYPDPEAISQSDSVQSKTLVLEKFKFLGAVIGKALYEGVLVDLPFAQFFLGVCLNQLPGFNDLPTLDEDLYRGLVALKNYTATETLQVIDNSNGEDEIYRVFGLDFTITISTRNGTRTVPLVPKGETVKVTAQNRLLYLDLIAQYKLVKQIEAPVKAFMSGLHSIIPPVWLRLLFASPLELSRLLSGDSRAIDVADWKRNTVYDGVYRDQGATHPTMVAFWDTVENEFTETQRRYLCKFATSCERPPLLGFAELNPRFCISGAASAEQEDRLPSASTCVNLLKMPAYSSRHALRDKLTTAVESNSGFDLS
ncbi:hypothetical protein BX070DRAFT_224279 [Coemansia spiralis]|nr:hypothetical protein BX070DRAFT_224279 [Coemansia spiralis]